MKSIDTFSKPAGYIQAIIHMICLAVLFNLILLFDFTDGVTGDPDLPDYLIRHNFYSQDLVYMLLLAIFSEASYQILFKPGHFYYFLIGPVLIVLFTAVILFLHFPRFPNHSLSSITVVPIVAGTYTLLYGLLRNYFRERIFRSEVRTVQLEGALNSLKAQVNPHFFFNTLNYLYGTALKEKAVQTAEGIDLVASMMRYSLTGAQEVKVPLRDELTFLQTYITLQKLRIPDERPVKIICYFPEPEDQMIAPMLLIPFIENAFMYGLSMDQECSIIIQSTLSNNHLTFKVKNTIFTNKKVGGSGNGISLTKQRLDLLYPENYRLNIHQEQDSYHVDLSIDL